MISLEDIRIYLPKYLSAEGAKELLQELDGFPNNIDKIYTNYLKKEEKIFQGDGLEKLLIINLPDSTIKEAKGMVISNSCDIDKENTSFNNSRLCYVPIFSFDKYIKMIERKKLLNSEQIDNHAISIKKQMLTHIFYLPPSDRLEESVVFFDRINSCLNDYIKRKTLQDIRLFTLSDYGFYVFLIKLSIHFTRIREGVQRSPS